MTDDLLIAALCERVRIGPRTSGGEADEFDVRAPASPERVAAAESQLGFQLPPLLRRLYLEVADGGFGPGFGMFPVGEHRAAGSEETIVEVHARLATDPAWPGRLLPICDWGCANWSCLDCRSKRGPIVTLAGEQGFFNTGHDLRSWLEAWLAHANLWSEMFEPGPTMIGMNPFTREPIEMRGQGSARGRRWPSSG